MRNRWIYIIIISLILCCLTDLPVHRAVYGEEISPSDVFIQSEPGYDPEEYSEPEADIEPVTETVSGSVSGTDSMIGACEISDPEQVSEVMTAFFTDDSDDPEETVSQGEFHNSVMRVSFLDVGHGDSAVIECGGEAMLIDAGNYGMGEIVSDYLKSREITELKYVVATHPHNDHIGGMPSVLLNHDCKSILTVNIKRRWIKNGGLTARYRSFENAVSEKNIPVFYPDYRDDTEYTLGKGEEEPVKIKVLGPTRLVRRLNNDCLALMISFHNIRFLFIGDAENREEKDLVRKNKDIKCDVYKVAHHGMSNASSAYFLDNITPEYAVISCAAESQWSAPGRSCLNRLKKRGIKTFRTDRQGNIIAESDGNTISWNAVPVF